MRRPLVAVALCYGGGLLLAEFFHPPLGGLLVSTFAVLALALVWPRVRWHLLWPLLVLAGWTNLISRTAVISPHDLRRVMTEDAALATVRGTLTETPSLRVFTRNELESWRTLAQVQVTELRRGANWQPASGSIIVGTTGALPADFFAEQTVEITGVLTPPPTPVAQGLFDYRAHLARQGIYFQLKADSTNAWRLVPPFKTTRPLADRFRAWAKAALARGLPQEDESLRLEWALTLGWKAALTDEVSEPFVRSATYHIFAVDGLRMAIIFGIFFALFQALGLPRAARGLLLIPLIWFYTALTGWPASAIRATVMLTIVIFGWALKRPSDLINSLFAAALVILLWEPQQLFQAGFQLSFFVVLCIILTVPTLTQFGQRLLKSDPMLPDELRPRWQQVLHPPTRFLLDFLLVSFAAWIGSIPLAAYYFHIVTPVSAPANLVAVPLCALVLVSNLTALLFAGWFPAAAELFNHAGWFLMECIRVTSHWFADWPGAYFYVSPPSLLTFAVYYTLLLGTLSGWLLAPRRRAWAIAGIFLVAAIYFWQWQKSRARFEFTILPLNGAHSVFADGPGRKNDWLMDCGNTNSVEFVMKPFLRAQGVNRLPRLLLTHGDLRHVGGTEMVEQLFGVDEIFTSAVRFRSPAYRRIVENADAIPGRHVVINRGNAAGAWRVLHPTANDKFPQADDNALVLLGEFHGTRVLLLSDLGRPGQEALLARETDLRADIVVTGLPEQTEPLCDALLDAIRPQVIIVADSEFPATKRASPRLHDRLTQRRVPVLYTRFTGAVTLTIGKTGWELRAMDGTHFARGEISPK